MRREAAGMLMQEYKVSERRACSVVGQDRSTYRYRSRLFEPSGLRARLREHAAAHRRWGYKKMTILLRRDGYGVNHKRVYRIYRQEKLLVHQRRRRRRCAALTRVPPAKATRPNQHWAMDFMSDALASGRRFRVFTLMDHFTREGLALRAAFSLPARTVVEALDELAAERGFPWYSNAHASRALLANSVPLSITMSSDVQVAGRHRVPQDAMAPQVCSWRWSCKQLVLIGSAVGHRQPRASHVPLHTEERP